MKKTIYMFMGAAIVFASCKKSFLETPDKTIVLRQAYIEDLGTAKDYLNGVYVNMSRDFFAAWGVIYPELISDNLKPLKNTMRSSYNWSQIPSSAAGQTGLNFGDDNINTHWYLGYRIINGVNFFLEEIGKYETEDVNKANSLKAQALVIRAMMHYYLVCEFAQSPSFTSDASHPGIPYVTSSNWIVSNKRFTVKEVYDFMINDIKEAIKLFPNDSGSKIELSSRAAKALLARIYLFGQKFEEAKNFAVQATQTTPIMTSGYPANLFTSSDTEAIFQLAPGPATGQSTDYTFFAGLFFTDFKEFSPTTDITEILQSDPDDKRNAWIRQKNQAWDVVKFPSSAVAGAGYAGGMYYQTLIRSSEMCLTAAESYANLNKPDSARYYLDMIRKRANPNASATVASGTELLELIYLERRKELVFEGLRMFDLLRWKKPVERKDALSAESRVLSYPNNRAIAPIPLQDVELSGLEQNKGY